MLDSVSTRLQGLAAALILVQAYTIVPATPRPPYAIDIPARPGDVIEELARAGRARWPDFVRVDEATSVVIFGGLVLRDPRYFDCNRLVSADGTPFSRVIEATVDVRFQVHGDEWVTRVVATMQFGTTLVRMGSSEQEQAVHEQCFSTHAFEADVMENVSRAVSKTLTQAPLGGRCLIAIQKSLRISDNVGLKARLDAAPKLLVVQELRIRVVNMIQPRELLATIMLAGFNLPARPRT